MGAREDKQDIKKKAVLKYLKANRCLVATACKKADIARNTYYEWLKADPEFKSKVQDLLELEVDGVESILGNLIDQENASAVQFYLRAKGQDRGFGQKVEVSGEIGIANINIIKPPNAE
jgi:hypothetical protein